MPRNNARQTRCDTAYFFVRPIAKLVWRQREEAEVKTQRRRLNRPG
jgi:hypothetical protein